MEPQEKQENVILGLTLTLAHLAERVRHLVPAPEIHAGFFNLRYANPFQ